MADLIDRDAVIWITAETGALETQRRVKELPAVNRWIPCSERLPETRMPVLCYCHAYTGNKYNVAYLDGDWFVECYSAAKLKQVSHWMPLPEPPKE